MSDGSHGHEADTGASKRPDTHNTSGEPQSTGAYIIDTRLCQAPLQTTVPDIIVEADSEIHRQFREAHEGHKPHEALDSTRSSTGVVWVTGTFHIASQGPHILTQLHQNEQTKQASQTIPKNGPILDKVLQRQAISQHASKDQQVWKYLQTLENMDLLLGSDQ
jgi:hypothetical protein